LKRAYSPNIGKVILQEK